MICITLISICTVYVSTLPNGDKEGYHSNEGAPRAIPPNCHLQIFVNKQHGMCSSGKLDINERIPWSQ